MSAKILVADDEQSLRFVLGKALEAKGYAVDYAVDGDEAWKRLGEGGYALAFLDVKMPGPSGLDLLTRCRGLARPPMVIIMTAQNTMQNAVQAMKLGAYDYLTKPFDLEQAELLAARALESRRKERELATAVPKAPAGAEAAPPAAEGEPVLLGRSGPMQQIYKLIGRVADSTAAVLIHGESGTGKELIARITHLNSSRAKQPFVAVNAAAIPRDLLESELFGHEKGAFTGATDRRKGKFELASGGTLFLDEIGEMSLDLQSKLLRVLQDGTIDRVGGEKPIRVDVRLITATNRQLSDMVRDRTFREDLYYRLNVIQIEVPPLRARKEDIPLLADSFLARYSAQFSLGNRYLAPDAVEALRNYAFPGNVRELENLVKRALLLSSGNVISRDDIVQFFSTDPVPGAAEAEASLESLVEQHLVRFIMKTDLNRRGELYHQVLEMAERPLLRLVLDRLHSNQLRAADALGINRNTLRKRLKELGLKE
ncbi:MAG: sigma-54-dependent Fis family transcriptional regulator [Deltaproteobacteria bacterium]|nr:sigma-54-dependent Fis family transcriptional regulator [Deltaproteobacteria bacterium]